ncbi:hypothetical protein [Desulfosporosinus sp. Sb-LF]|uniref:hypothetical protein n=1 Tax=Desulfosporosinus sp. Sb-LF TaxID=2560027 RepID=UPI001A7E4054|nr:hypothetical protein [Desulfosporosinus sp. Sb-LF]
MRKEVKAIMEYAIIGFFIGVLGTWYLLRCMRDDIRSGKFWRDENGDFHMDK